MSTLASFFRWRWSAAVGWAALLVVVFVGDFLFNQLIIVPLLGEDTLLLQCVLAVPLGVAAGYGLARLWISVERRALAHHVDDLGRTWGGDPS